MPASPKHRSPPKRPAPRGPLPPARAYDRRRAVRVRVSRSTLTVTLDDGRVLAVPLSTLPRVAAAPMAARRTLELLGGGIGIHFPQCDEDISVANLLQPQLTMHYRRRTKA